MSAHFTVSDKHSKSLGNTTLPAPSSISFTIGRSIYIMPSSIATMLGTAGLGLLSSSVLSFSFFGAPVVLTAPPELQPVLFKRMFALGKNTMPIIGVATASALAYSYATSKVKEPHYLYSAGLALAIVPFTLLFMMPTIKACHELRPDLESCIKRWSTLNLIRGAFPLAAFVLNLIFVVKV
ncbi:uncharacterized protein V1513DRAFT_446453 [Lipomyces chichibuensis]|uniref:uncharacterized protein n=1 Tax=Lipomyces chichibuensis TaxID=1546026 RepID=UPI003342FBF0